MTNLSERRIKYFNDMKEKQLWSPAHKSFQGKSNTSAAKERDHHMLSAFFDKIFDGNIRNMPEEIKNNCINQFLETWKR